MTKLDKDLLAVAQSSDLEKVKHLIGEGADPNATGFLKQTPLIIASIHNQPDLVAYLANLPAIELNRVDDLGRTALFFAGRNGNLDVLNILLDSGADSTIGNVWLDSASRGRQELSHNVHRYSVR